MERLEDNLIRESKDISGKTGMYIAAGVGTVLMIGSYILTKDKVLAGVVAAGSLMSIPTVGACLEWGRSYKRN